MSKLDNIDRHQLAKVDKFDTEAMGQKINTFLSKYKISETGFATNEMAGTSIGEFVRYIRASNRLSPGRQLDSILGQFQSSASKLVNNLSEPAKADCIALLDDLTKDHRYQDKLRQAYPSASKQQQTEQSQFKSQDQFEEADALAKLLAEKKKQAELSVLTELLAQQLLKIEDFKNNPNWFNAIRNIGITAADVAYDPYVINLKDTLKDITTLENRQSVVQTIKDAFKGDNYKPFRDRLDEKVKEIETEEKIILLSNELFFKCSSINSSLPTGHIADAILSLQDNHSLQKSAKKYQEFIMQYPQLYSQVDKVIEAINTALPEPKYKALKTLATTLTKEAQDFVIGETLFKQIDDATKDIAKVSLNGRDAVEKHMESLYDGILTTLKDNKYLTDAEIEKIKNSEAYKNNLKGAVDIVLKTPDTFKEAICYNIAKFCNTIGLLSISSYLMTKIEPKNLNIMKKVEELVTPAAMLVTDKTSQKTARFNNIKDNIQKIIKAKGENKQNHSSAPTR